MTRRQLIVWLGGAIAGCPFALRAQQQVLPVIGFLNGGAADASERYLDSFRKGLSESGCVEGRHVTVEYHWLDGQYHRLAAVVADLVRSRVAVIASPGFTPGALAAKAATTTIPIVFGVGDDPVKLGVVTSLARPGGNATGINFFVHEIVSKRLGLLHELVPKAVRIAVLINPGNAAAAEATLNEARQAAPAMRQQILAFSASTIGEIDAAFAAMVREGSDALLVGGDGFLYNRRHQITALAMRYRLPAISGGSDFPQAGFLMSYGTDTPEMFRQAGMYAGTIVNGTKPADLPVLQSTKFELVINLNTAKVLGLDVPSMLLARADQVIE